MHIIYMAFPYYKTVWVEHITTVTTVTVCYVDLAKIRLSVTDVTFR